MIEPLKLTDEEGNLLKHQEFRKKINEIISFHFGDTEKAATETPDTTSEDGSYKGWKPVNDTLSYFHPPVGYTVDGVHIAGIVPSAEVPADVLAHFKGAAVEA